MIGHILRRLIGGILFSVLLAYVIDSGVVRYRAAHGQDVFGHMTVRQLDLVPQKNGRMQILPDDSDEEDCVHSLFPQLGDPPCWWLERHREKRVQM